MLNIWCTIDIYFHGENLYTAILSLSPIGSFFERLLVDDISRFEFESAIVLRIDEKKKKKNKIAVTWLPAIQRQNEARADITGGFFRYQ